MKSLEKNFKIDFVGIGAIKSGTTWIYECLQEHPQVCLAPKDQAKIAFFLKSSPLKEEIDQYQSFLPSKNCELIGDFHVAYMKREESAERIKRHNPDIKLIVCFRNPIEMVYSLYRYAKFSKHKNWESFEQGLKVEPAMLESGFYYKYLEKFFSNFPKENILVLIYEDIWKDKVKFIQQIYKFLGVNDSFVPQTAHLKVNLTKFKLTRLGRFLHKRIISPLLRNTRWAWKLKRSILIKKILCGFSEFYVSKKDSAPQIKEETRRYLQNLYRDDIKSLEKLINRDLSYWK